MYCFFAHHRSASSSTNDILRELARHFGWRHITVHNSAMYDNDLRAFCRARCPDLLTLSNARGEQLDHLSDFRGIHLIRDPRDVLVSSNFSHRESHSLKQWPELQAHREELQSVNKEQGLLLEMDCRAEQFTDLDAWQYNDPRVLEWKMEALTKDPGAHFHQLLDFWDLQLDTADSVASSLRPSINRVFSGLENRLPVYRLPRWRTEKISQGSLDAAQARHSFDRKVGGRAPGKENEHHHYRKGTQGDWRSHFSAPITERFKERFGGLLVKLGYEQGYDW